MKSLFVYVSMVLLLGVGSLCAQPYSTGLGIRLGQGTSITGKMFVLDNHAIESIFTIRNRGFEMTALYEKHAEAFNVSQLNWFFGFGGHLGYQDPIGSETSIASDQNNVFAGVDGIIGLEYTVGAIPIAFSIDYKPMLNLAGNQDFVWAGGLSVRYLF